MNDKSDPEDHVWKVMDGGLGGDAIGSSHQHLAPDWSEPEIELRSAIIGFDTNALLRVVNSSSGNDAIDFLSVRHDGPLIVPLQTLAEFWNNIDSFQRDLRSDLSNQLDQIRSIIDQVPTARFGGELHTLLNDLTKHAWVDGSLKVEDLPARIGDLLNALVGKGNITSVSRSRFRQLGSARMAAKTPPGFKDDGKLGDFFVWADWLLGLAAHRAKATHAVFVTEDRKKDWYRAGVAHPILFAEVYEVSSLSFSLMPVSTFLRLAQDT